MAISFDFINRIGAGAFGEVWKVRDVGLNTIFALKCIPLDKVINPDNFFLEAQILKEAEHPNIVKVEETGKLQDGRVYVKMEFLEKGSLEDEASGSYIQLTRAKKLMIDVLRGLEHAHSKKIVHRDIKPANILIGHISEGKLSDFGLALPDFKKVDFGKIKDYQYILHLAPEVNNLSAYSFQADIYACGVTLYRLVNGDSYLPQISPIDVLSFAKKGKYPDRNKYRDFIPRSIKLLINKAINIDPNKRFQTAREMRTALEQVNIQMNWDEKILSNGIRWRTSNNNIIFDIRRIEHLKGGWEILTRKGKSKDSLRKVNEYCSRNLSKKDAVKECKRILQGYVNGNPK